MPKQDVNEDSLFESISQALCVIRNAVCFVAWRRQMAVIFNQKINSARQMVVIFEKINFPSCVDRQKAGPCFVVAMVY